MRATSSTSRAPGCPARTTIVRARAGDEARPDHARTRYVRTHLEELRRVVGVRRGRVHEPGENVRRCRCFEARERADPATTRRTSRDPRVVCVEETRSRPRQSVAFGVHFEPLTSVAAHTSDAA